MLKITVESSGDNVTLHCSGRILRGNETGLLCSATRHHGRNIVLDLADVETIDAAGIGALVSLQAAGIYLKLMNPNDRVRAVLEMTHLNSVFEICRSQSLGEPSAAVIPCLQLDRVRASVA